MLKNPVSTITDTISYQFSDTNDLIHTLTGGSKEYVNNNTHVLVILILIGSLYMIVNNKDTSSDILEIIDNPLTKIGIIGVLVYMSKNNPLTSLAAIIVFCLTIQSLQSKKKPAIIDILDEEVPEEEEGGDTGISIDDIIEDQLKNKVEVDEVVAKNESDVTIDDDVTNAFNPDALTADMNSFGAELTADVNSAVNDVDVNTVSDDINSRINTIEDTPLANQMEAGGLIDGAGGAALAQQDIQNTLNKASVSVSDTVGQFIDNAPGTVGQFIDNAPETVGRFIDNAPETVGQFIDNAHGAGNQFVDNVQRVSGNIRNGVSEFSNQVAGGNVQNSDETFQQNPSVEAFSFSEMDNYEKF